MNKPRPAYSRSPAGARNVPGRHVVAALAALLVGVLGGTGCDDTNPPAADPDTGPLARSTGTREPVSSGRTTPVASRRSIVLVTLDTTRADHIGCYGDSSAATPVIDRLAARGTRFAMARSCVPITLPSHTTMLTGTLPPRHGIHDNATGTLAERAETLAEVFSRAGWATGAFVASFVLNAQYGLAQGFDIYDDVPDRQLVSGGFLEERRAGEVIDAALAWLASQGDDPVFMWVHLFDAHAPYAPPPPFASRFAAAPYDGEIAYADAQLGRLARALEDRDRLEQTVLIVTADHGEGLEDHDETSHALFVYDSTLHVPLLFSGGDLARGRVIDSPVSLVDLAPTLIDLAGLEIPDSMQGRSLAAALRPGDPQNLVASPTYFESYSGYLNHGWSPLAGMVRGALKMIDAPRPELYDLADDPGELHDLAARRPGDVESLREETHRIIRTLSAAGSLSDLHEPSPLERSRLEALGYLGSQADREAALPLPSPDRPDPKDKISVQKRRVLVLDLVRSKQLVAAEKLARETLAENPDDAFLNEYLGTTLAMQGRFAEAERPLLRCLARRPDRIEARFTLAFSLYKLDRIEEAVAEARECLQHAPGWVKAARWIAQIEMQRGHLAAARPFWQMVLDNWKGDPKLLDEARTAIARIDRESGGMPR